MMLPCACGSHPGPKIRAQGRLPAVSTSPMPEDDRMIMITELDLQKLSRCVQSRLSFS